jgi:hypothetical protein
MFLLGKEEGINQLSKLATSALHTSSLRRRLSEAYGEIHRGGYLSEVVMKYLNVKTT